MEDESREIVFAGTAVSPPSAPQSVAAVTGIGTIKVSWAAPADTGGLPITRYDAKAFTTATGDESGWYDCYRTTGMSCTIFVSTSGQTYWVAVAATNGAGQSAYSSPRVAVTPLSMVSVHVVKAGYGNQMFVNVAPNMGDGYWTFRVQRRTAAGGWTTLPTVYRTYGRGETRRLTLGPGTFRVKVAPKYGYLGATSAAVVLTRPIVRVEVAKVGYGNKLSVDVDPNRGSGYWTFSVQRRTAAGGWTTLPTVYRTSGTAETRTLTLGPGTFRVKVGDRYGFVGATSSAVTLTRPIVRVRAAKTGYGDKLFVNVDPNVGAGYWTFRVQRRTAAGGWTTLPTVYRTRGRAETRTLTLGPGTFRVLVSGKYGYVGRASAEVVLTRPTVKVRLTTDSARDKLLVDVDPDRGSGYWTFQVQKGDFAFDDFEHPLFWTTLPPVYRTEGSAETRTVNLRSGMYRVVVAPKYGYEGATSRRVDLAG